MKGTRTSRQSFLVKDGKVVWNMLKASTDTQAKDVLAAYEALGKKVTRSTERPPGNANGVVKLPQVARLRATWGFGSAPPTPKAVVARKG
jgi:hypothetical protein